MSPEQTDKLLAILDRAVTAQEQDLARRETRAKKSDELIEQLMPLALRLVAQSMGGPQAVADGPDATVTPLHDDTKGPTQ